MYIRKDYTNGRCSHRDYYAQFVTPGIIALVLHGIGEEVIRASSDEHMNDIPLHMWDKLASSALGSAALKNAGDDYTQAGGVCILKEAACQIKDVPLTKDDNAKQTPPAELDPLTTIRRKYIP